MSVGRTASPPSRAPRRPRSTSRSPRGALRRPDRGPPRSFVTRTSTKPSSAQQRRRRRRLPGPDLERRGRRRARAPPPPPGQPPRSRRRRSAPRAAPSRGPRAAGSAARPASTYGGLETIRSQGPAGSRWKRSRWSELDGEPGALGDSRPRAPARPSDASMPGDDRAGMLVGDRERDRARSRCRRRARGAARSPASSASARSTSDLRLRPGDQRPTVDGQRQPAESPLAEDVLQRLAPRPPRRRAPARRRAPPRSAAGRAPCTARSAAGPSALASSRSASSRGVSDPLRPGARSRAAARRRPCRRATARPDADVAHAPAASSERRRSSAWIASVNSSRSPSRIWSSRCTVSLIRWSVSRFSGKL